MTCNSCVKEISEAVKDLAGISKIDADIAKQIVAIEGNAPPSAIVAAIQQTGRDAILRGSGAPNSAAVCILETHSSSVSDKVRGLARMVQVSPNLTIIDLSIRGISAGKYFASIRQAGDISRGPESTGDVWDAKKAQQEGKTSRGLLGTLEVSKNGIGSVFIDRPIQIWELIGRSMVVSRVQDGKFDKEDANTLVGVIARSAGVWDNDKTVCSCTGKTVWEERQEQVDKGML
ncbi:superoxide dismutase copper chaperone-like protein [Microthyrium microscopicum]|uniref:Superoxide dismutase 1 copper chaperone n=1 Tax=Microthyrium microscopicum TaxID=703497 RepID=A0A6A6UM57_9PEZI|nr:superoxide dismutase copper chaperone-like protein [Microthyrium microscopicum]